MQRGGIDQINFTAEPSLPVHWFRTCTRRRPDEINLWSAEHDRSGMEQALNEIAIVNLIQEQAKKARESVAHEKQQHKHCYSVHVIQVSS